MATSNPRPALALALGALLTLGAVTACGSDAPVAAPRSGGADAASTESPDGSSDEPPATTDACAWFSESEMGELLGFDVTREGYEGPQGPKCDYDNEDEYTSVEIELVDEAAFDTLRSFSGTESGKQAGAGTAVEVDGLGAEAFRLDDGSGQPSDALHVKLDDGGAVSILLSTASDRIADDAAGQAITSEIAAEIAG